MAHSRDTTISWQETSACVFQITSRESKSNQSSVERNKRLGDKGPNLSADPREKIDVFRAQTCTPTQLASSSSPDLASGAWRALSSVF